MAYADYNYYVQEYLLGTEPKIPDSEYDFFEKKAEKELDRYTYGRIKANKELLTSEVMECICELAEFLYEAEIVDRKAKESGLAGHLVSWSNDGESGTIDLSHSVYTESGKKTKVKEIIRLHLGGTGLLYAGV